MRSLLRPAPVFVLLTYVLLTAVPFLPTLLGRQAEHPGQLLGAAVLAWLAAWALLQRPAWFHRQLLPA
jgi:hypothetical protein